MKKRKPLDISKQNIVTTVRKKKKGKRTIIKRTK